MFDEFESIASKLVQNSASMNHWKKLQQNKMKKKLMNFLEKV